MHTECPRHTHAHSTEIETETENEIETVILIRFEQKIENNSNYIEIKIFTTHAWNT